MVSSHPLTFFFLFFFSFLFFFCSLLPHDSICYPHTTHGRSAPSNLRQVADELPHPSLSLCPTSSLSPSLSLLPSRSFPLGPSPSLVYYFLGPITVAGRLSVGVIRRREEICRERKQDLDEGLRHVEHFLLRFYFPLLLKVC